MVISIISLLSSVVLSSLTSARNAACDTKRISLFKGIEKSLEVYYSDNNQYPSCTGVNTWSSPGSNLSCLENALSPYIVLDLNDELTSYLKTGEGGSGSGFYFTSKSVNDYQTYGMFIRLMENRNRSFGENDGGYFGHYEAGQDPQYCKRKYPTGDGADWFHTSNRCRGD